MLLSQHQREINGLSAVIACLPMCVTGLVCVIFAERLQKSHIRSREALYRKLPLLEKLDIFRDAMYSPIRIIETRVGGLLLMAVAIYISFQIR